MEAVEGSNGRKEDGSNSTVGEWTGGWKMEGRRRNGGVTRGSRRKKSKKEGRTERRREPEENRIGNGGNGKKEEIDWVRSWLEQIAIKQIESMALTLFFGSW